MAGTYAPSQTALNYRADIDGIRAIAILLVCAFHFHLFPIGDAGFIGVDLFFVLSGFLITRILITSLETDTFDLGSFYLARLRRLMPALVATLALYLLAGYFLLLPDRFAELSIEAFLSQIYIVNIYFWRSINYFGLTAEYVPLLHMWSLSIEEQFYIFYPLALALVFRYARRLLFAFGCSVFLISFVLCLFSTGWKPQATFYLLPTRAWELLAGGLIAIRVPAGLQNKTAAKMAGPLGLALLVTALVIHTPITSFPGWFAVLPVAAGVFLILGGPATPTARLLSWAPFVWIGKISYPLYLVHWPILILLGDSFETVTLTGRWIGFGLSVFMAWGIWRWVERPIRTKTIFPGTQSFLLVAGSATAGLCLISWIGWSSAGLPNRFSAEVQTVLTFADDTPKPFNTCGFEPKNPSAAGCSIGKQGQPVTILVFGDSHAQAMAGAYDIWLNDNNRAGILHFRGGCNPIQGARPALCGAYFNHVMKHIKQIPTLKTVILNAAWQYNPSVFDGRYVTGAEADDTFKKAFENTLAQLQDAGVNVVLVDPMFYAANLVPRTLAHNAHFGTERPINRDLEDHQGHNATVLATFETASAAQDVQRISLIGDLCKTGTCTSILNGEPVFTDNNHVRFGLSDYFATQLRTIILSQ